MPTPLFHQIKFLANQFGFDHIAAARPLIPSKDQDAYQAWCDDGLAAGMDYMKRDPQKRMNVAEAYPGVKTILTLGVSYYQGPLPEKPGPGYGRVARYAWGLDYHDVIPKRLEQFLKKLPDIIGPTARATVAVDTKPLLERSLAAQAGLGFIGKNTVLIMPRSQNGTPVGFHVGSFVFLTEILLDVEIADVDAMGGLPPVALAKGGCGSCTKCLTVCPTNAFEGPYRLNASKCISYLTIENKGEIPADMRAEVGDWLFGCDACQDVCPFNGRAYETMWPEFQADKGTGAWISLKEILSIPDQPAFKAKWGHTPLSRGKRKGLIRNACVVAGNSGDRSLVSVLDPLRSDEDPLVRDHALWALEKLS